MADTEGLFAAHQNRLFRYFCRAVGRAEAAARPDAGGLPAREPDRDSRGGGWRGDAWLFRIARNLALDHHRRRLRQPEPAALVDEPTRSASQDVNLAVNEALASLPALDRDVFLMREVAGLGYEEIAGACELTPDAVRSRIHRTRLQLRDLLAAPIATSRTMATSRAGQTYERIDR